MCNVRDSMLPSLRPSSPPPLLLPDHVRVLDVAEDCRAAALAFMNEVAYGGRKEHLAEWLAGPYREATAYAADIGIDGWTGGGARQLRSLDDDMIARLIRATHREAMQTLEAIALPQGGVGFVFEVLAAGFVVRCEDIDGAAGWATVAPRRMRLADRVLSVIAADYLARAEDYEELLAVCARCAFVGFDAIARGRGVCRAHATSGFRFFPESLPDAEGEAERNEPTRIGLG